MTNIRTALLLAGVALVLGACDRAPEAVGTTDRAATPAPANPQDPTDGLPPPLLVPGENTDPAQAPSYEVTVASAAADHNKALERCAKQPQAVRTQCEQEANTAFSDVQKSLEPLRGNPE